MSDYLLKCIITITFIIYVNLSRAYNVSLSGELNHVESSYAYNGLHFSETSETVHEDLIVFCKGCNDLRVAGCMCRFLFYVKAEKVQETTYSTMASDTIQYNITT